ncbi:cephalosporin hydroxylase family protein [Thiovibrio sp. JS02]
MKLIIDTSKNTIVKDADGVETCFDLYGKEAFELLSRQWVKTGWSQKYQYTFSWMGRPIIQLPEDMLRMQEVLYRVQPDVIVETGIAHGGSLIYYASLCRVMGKGRIIGVDIEIRPHNRQAIEEHPLFPLITLIEGSSTASDVVAQVKSHVKPGEKVLVILDSNHSRQHVLAELEAYHDLVTSGSYIVATDGIMFDLFDVPRGAAEWKWDNPAEAAVEFQAKHSDFVLEQPPWLFNESELSENITHWPKAWLRKQ